jgi:hypothetical protein
MYRACQGVITQIFGPEFYSRLDKHAQRHLARG